MKACVYMYILECSSITMEKNLKHEIQVHLCREYYDLKLLVSEMD
jgi:hypothetical protein